MCRLCRFASSSPEFSKQIEESFVKDMDLVRATRVKKPETKSVFTNLKNWMTMRFNFALFEPLLAFPNPRNYYQAMTVDGEKLRVDWSSGWTRSIGFMPNGNILVYTKATEREEFTKAEWFRHYYLLEFSPDQLEITFQPPRFIIRANDVKLKGTNLVSHLPEEHVFSFAFSHLATEKSAMRAEAAKQSAFYREILKRAEKQTGQAQADAKSDFERYIVTTHHFAPHPMLMRLNKPMGFGSRFEFQVGVPGFLEEHFRKIAQKKDAGGKPGNV